MASPIETNKLLSVGFLKNGSIYLCGDNEVRYDGCYWYLNGEKINDDFEELKNKIQ